MASQSLMHLFGIVLFECHLFQSSCVFGCCHTIKSKTITKGCSWSHSQFFIKSLFFHHANHPLICHCAKKCAVWIGSTLTNSILFPQLWLYLLENNVIKETAIFCICAHNVLTEKVISSTFGSWCSEKNVCIRWQHKQTAESKVMPQDYATHS